MSGSVLNTLKGSLPENRIQRVLRSLRFNSLIWNSIQDQTFLDQVVEAAKFAPELWAPAGLALIKIGFKNPSHFLGSPIDETLEADLEHRSAAYFDAVLNNSIETAVTLDQAGMAAVALRIKFQQQRNWEFLDDMISLRSEDFWNPVFACLFGLISEPINMIQWMISSSKSRKVKNIGIHSLLSNPLPLTGQVNILTQIFSYMGSEERLALLRNLNSSDKTLTQNISEKLLEMLGTAEYEEADFNSLHEVYETAELLRYAGKYEQALPLLDSARRITDKYQENLAYQIGMDASQNEQDKIAQTAFDRVRSNSEAKSFSKESVSSIESLEKAIKNDPNNINLLISLTKKNILAGNNEAALESATLASALSPHDLKVKKNLASAMSSAQKWDQAEKVYKNIVENSVEKSSDELATLANISLKNGNLAGSIESASKALEIDQVNAYAHAVIGKAMMGNGDEDKAVQHLNQAISIDPETPETWLTLAYYHIKQGRNQVAIDNLKVAIVHLPKNSAVRFALGELYEIEDHQNEALEEYKIAYKNSDAVCSTLRKKINLQYGQALLATNNTESAEKVLFALFENGTTDSEIISAYAKALIANGQSEKAMNILAGSVENRTASIEMQLDYAIALIKSNTQIEKAEALVNEILSKYADNPLALLTQAELLAAKGDFEAASINFKQIIQSKSILDLPLKYRVYTGLAEVSRKNGQPEAAIAVLETFRDEHPNQTNILKILHRSYLEQNLVMKANEILHQILVGCQHDYDSLIWAADQASSTGDHNMAINALTFALEIAEDKSSILTRLGQEHVKNQDPASAKVSFRKLLDIEDVQASEYELAAKALMDLDKNETIPYLSKAIECDHSEKTTLLSDLVKIYLDKGDFKLALNAIEEQLALDPNNVAILKTKSDLHIRLNDSDAAISTINKIIEIEPNETETRMQASKIYFESGDVDKAIANATEVVSLDPTNHEAKVNLLKLLFNNLSFTQAYDLCLNTSDSCIEIDNYNALLAAMLDLPDILSIILEKYDEANDFRWNSLKTIALINSGEYTKAQDVYVEAWSAWQDFRISMNEKDIKAENILGLVLAAMKTQRWEDALQLSRVFKNSGAQPLFSNYLLARVFVEQAEYQELCGYLNVQVNGPGAITLSPSFGQECRQAIESAGLAAKSAEAKSAIDRLNTRCSYVFSNSIPNYGQKQSSSSEIAAALAVSRKTGTGYSLDGIKPEYLEDARVHIQLALNLMDSEASDAFDHALLAYETKSEDPLYLAALALTAEKAGDMQIAMNSINQALLHWSNEPHWHAFAGKVAHSLGYLNNAIHSYEQAIQIDPNQASYYIELGKLYLESKSYNDSVRILEIATGLAPTSTEVWKNLAKAYAKMDLSVEAKEAFEKVFELEPNGISSYIFAVEVALISSDFDTANNYLMAAENVSPSNADVLKLKAQLYARTY
jgi:tetratricopeptide (TPR) repeat protein